MTQKNASKSTVNSQLNEAELCTKLMTEQVVEPFIKLLEVLVEKGCDPNSKVQKLKWIREVDEKLKDLQG